MVDRISYTIQTKLPSLNEYISAERTNKFIASKLKKKYTNICAGCAMVIKNKIDKEGLYDLQIHWQVENSRSDSDNIFFSVKFIADGLVTAGVLKGDSRKYIRNISHTIETTKKNLTTVTLVKENVMDMPFIVDNEHKYGYKKGKTKLIGFRPTQISLPNNYFNKPFNVL